MDPLGKVKRHALLRTWGAWGEGKREGGRGGRRKNGRGEENLRKRDDRDGGMTERKSKERDILIDGAIKRLARNLTIGKFP